MPSEVGIWDDSHEANADLSAKNNLFGKLVAGNKVDVAGAGEGHCIIIGGTTAGHATAIRRIGKALLTVNGNSVNIAVGDPLKSAANGIGVKAATDKDRALAIAEEAATTDGALIMVSIGAVPSWIGV